MAQDFALRFEELDSLKLSNSTRKFSDPILDHFSMERPIFRKMSFES